MLPFHPGSFLRLQLCRMEQHLQGVWLSQLCCPATLGSRNELQVNDLHLSFVKAAHLYIKEKQTLKKKIK